MREKRKRRKYFFKKAFVNIPRKEVRAYLEKEVFSLEAFESDVCQVSENLAIDKRIVRGVLESYFYNILLTINSIRKIKTKINVYGFFSLITSKGNRV